MKAELVVDALGMALTRFLEDGAFSASLRARARPRASAFSWDRAADETLAVYRKVAGRAP
jgi:glycosyltransferase involved in cell wall biosynthesis